MIKLPLTIFLVVLSISVSLFIFPNPNSFAQTTCGTGTTSIRTENGLVSVVGTSTQVSNISTNDKCIASNRALIPAFGIPTYDEVKSIFYDQVKTSTKIDKHLSTIGDKTHQDINLDNSSQKDHLYWVQGNLTISGNMNGNALGIIFVDGNLNIQANVLQPPPKTGLVFIVKGDINISETVTTIEAVLVNYKDLCSAYNFSTNSCPNSIEASKLTIQGSVLFLNPDTSTYPKFVRARNSTSNSEPAEELIYEPKYLAILRNVMSRNLTVWTEKQ